jgi:uncharacterized protein (DUF305 family)
MATTIGRRAAALVAVAALSGYAGAAAQEHAAAVATASAPDTSAADAKFMSGMIHHHAQAVRIAGWAPTHGASPAVRTLCERIVVGQRDEIALMSRWLRDNGLPVPTVDTSGAPMAGMSHASMDHGSMDHAGMDPMAMMPGMLSQAQLAQLDSARGPEFDRLFLSDMIRHHQGALTMVNQLFGSEGAAQNETVFRLASDVYADQSTEIGRMQRMLLMLPADGSPQ